MSATIDRRGFYLVKLEDGVISLVHYVTKGTVQNASDVQFVGAKSIDENSIRSALGQANGPFSVASNDYASNSQALIQQAETSGSAILGKPNKTILGVSGNTVEDLGLGILGAAAGGVAGVADDAAADPSDNDPSSDNSNADDDSASKSNAKKAAAGAAAGAATKTALQDATSAGVLAAIWAWLSTPSHWLLILKYIGGAVLLFFGLRELVDH